MMATSVGGELAIPTGPAVGAMVGLVNGCAVAVLRIPSMIFTLGVNSVLRGLMVAHTGGFAPQTDATPLMRWLAAGRLAGIPVALFVWASVSVAIVVLLNRTVFGKAVYATGAREAAAFLSSIRTRLVIIGAFRGAGICAAMAGVLLAGYSAQAYQGMGNAFLLPKIAAVVLGGTHILGGLGRYAGTVLRVILIDLLNSVLSIMQMPEAVRQIICGAVIIGMLLVHDRNERVTS